MMDFFKELVERLKNSLIIEKIKNFLMMWVTICALIFIYFFDFIIELVIDCLEWFKKVLIFFEDLKFSWDINRLRKNAIVQRKNIIEVMEMEMLLFNLNKLDFEPTVKNVRIFNNIINNILMICEIEDISGLRYVSKRDIKGNDVVLAELECSNKEDIGEDSFYLIDNRPKINYRGDAVIGKSGVVKSAFDPDVIEQYIDVGGLFQYQVDAKIGESSEDDKVKNKNMERISEKLTKEVESGVGMEYINFRDKCELY